MGKGSSTFDGRQVAPMGAGKPRPNKHIIQIMLNTLPSFWLIIQKSRETIAIITIINQNKSIQKTNHALLPPSFLVRSKFHIRHLSSSSSNHTNLSS
jgi:hypothetical protein